MRAVSDRVERCSLYGACVADLGCFGAVFPGLSPPLVPLIRWPIHKAHDFRASRASFRRVPMSGLVQFMTIGRDSTIRLLRAAEFW
jgi:hypothetical protein